MSAIASTPNAGKERDSIYNRMKLTIMEEDIPKAIIIGPDTTYSPLFWDEDGAAIGDYDYFLIGDEEYSTSSIEGLKEWFIKADKQLRAIIPEDIDVFYGYWHQFGDNHWRWCKAYIANEH